jgi:hypothetical protein
MRSLFSLFVVSLTLLGTARAEQIVGLQIGDTPFKVVVPDGYVRTSIVLPEMFNLTAAALPPASRLMESFITEADVKQLLLGKRAGSSPNYQAHAMRAAENITFNEAEWAGFRRETERQLGVIDANQVLQSGASGRDERIREASNGEFEMKIGEVSKPQVFGNDPKSVRFTMLVPMAAKSAQVSEQVSVECAGSIVYVHGKIVMLYVYRVHAKDNRIADLQALLDNYIARTLAVQ